MAEGGDGLLARSERANELPCRCGLPEQVGVDEPAGQQEAVVVARVGSTDRLVHADPAGRHVQVHPADPSAPQGHDVDLGAGRPQGSQRNDQLDLLEAVGRQAAIVRPLSRRLVRMSSPCRSMAESWRKSPCGGSLDQGAEGLFMLRWLLSGERGTHTRQPNTSLGELEGDRPVVAQEAGGRGPSRLGMARPVGGLRRT
jgi:hypothetical protein